MKHYTFELINKNKYSRDEYYKYENEQNKKAILFVADQVDEIRKIFQVQLDKPGKEKRDIAAEEIIKYLCLNAKTICEKNENYFLWFYRFESDSLITLAEIIDAANKGDVEDMKNKLDSLPWGQSNTGDQISYNAFQFAYWIFSDEAREKYENVFVENLSHYWGISLEEAKEKLDNIGKMNGLDGLIEANKYYEQMFNDQKQPGDN